MSNGINFNSFGDFSSNSNEGKVKLPICLVLDNSGSMNEVSFGRTTKIEELNRNVGEFINFVKNDTRAQKICELSVISFGGNNAKIEQGYSSVDKIIFKPLVAYGPTPMGEAISLAIDLLQKRRTWYKNEGIQHYKPILLLMSDGVPTDNYKVVAREFSELVLQKKIKIFPVGIGNDFNINVLQEFSPELPPKRITDVSGFTKLFELLSLSSSKPEDNSIDLWFIESL